jgi:3-deoxy-7-phosphoheptulonate synthase
MSEDPTWSKDSWRALPIKQQPPYADPAHVARVCGDITSLPPLVADAEIERLRAQLAEVAQGKRFLLQGGDCAERFGDCCAETVESKLKILLQMSLVLVWGGRVPVVRVGRIAGQYAKPRSSGQEMVTVDG